MGLNFVEHSLDASGGFGGGSIASQIVANDGDPLAFRPWVDPATRRTFIDRPTGRFVKNEAGLSVPEIQAVPTNNVSGFLRKDDWFVLDQAIVKAAKPRLRAVADLRSLGLQFSIPNGLGKTSLGTERQSDINEAAISMDGIRESFDDRPVFDIQNLPLPIIHKDFHFSARQLMASRNGGSPLDTTTAELAARRVAEQAEQLLLGTANFSAQSTSIYGYTNFPNRLTYTQTAPSGTNGTTTVNDVLEMRFQAQNAYHFGPYMLYASLDWDQYLDNDYKSTYNATTLRQRLKAIDGIIDVRTLDYLPTKTMVLVQMTPDVTREVVGMEITTVQWESKGGMQINFKVMAILVPQVRADYNGNSGIVHATHA